MSALSIVTLDAVLLNVPGSVLRQRCREIDVNDAAEMEYCRGVALEMFDVMYAGDGAATAAPQVGLALRFVTLDPRGSQVGPVVLINPVIVESSEAHENGIEGCMSLPGYCGDVLRSSEIVVHAYDLAGTLREFRAQGFMARVFQHEIDHLDGVLYADKLRPGASLVAAGSISRQRAEYAMQMLATPTPPP